MPPQRKLQKYTNKQFGILDNASPMPFAKRLRSQVNKSTIDLQTECLPMQSSKSAKNNTGYKRSRRRTSQQQVNKSMKNNIENNNQIKHVSQNEPSQSTRDFQNDMTTRESDEEEPFNVNLEEFQQARIPEKVIMDDLEDVDNTNRLAMERTKPIDLKINDVPSGENSFYEAAALDTYFVHPWPSGNSTRASCLDLLKRLHNEKSDLATVIPETVKLYSKHIKTRRTTLHQQVDKWLHHHFEPQLKLFLHKKLLGTKQKSLSTWQRIHGLFRSLFTINIPVTIFARKNYLTTGALLQNPMLVDCMKYVFLNDGGHTDRRIPEIPDPAPKQLIVLIYVTILYRLAKYSKCALYTENHNAHDFKENSLYNTIFDYLINENSPASRRINWVQVQEMIQREVEEDTNDGGWSTMRVLGEL
ncbi:hypothetical protein BDC45DRAFT_542725 [Circinella umbellata]|nr:hypothetical protein BDC45DRAFT_542725 [Circinella umbellata]